MPGVLVVARVRIVPGMAATRWSSLLRVLGVAGFGWAAGRPAFRVAMMVVLAAAPARLSGFRPPMLAQDHPPLT